jgi:hypothetical protein
MSKAGQLQMLGVDVAAMKAALVEKEKGLAA